MAPRERILASEVGFTLLETVLSAFFVSLAVVGVLMMFSNGQATVYSGGQNRIAAQLAQQRIEEVRAAGYGSTDLPDPREEDTWTAVPSNPGYERTTVITGVCSTNFAIAWNAGGCLPATTQPQTKNVVVTVRAQNGNTEVTDPQTTPAVLQTVLVRR